VCGGIVAIVIGVRSVSSSTGLVILAAGASTRMGRPKQLLLYQERSFLCHVVETAVASICQPIVVVLGAHAEQLKHEVSQLPVQVVENARWAEGMSSSIRAGILSLCAVPEKIEAAVLMLCDQPFVSPQIINQLVEAYHFTGKPIVASAYAETLGVPALFSSTLFSELMTLTEAEGAKKIIMKYTHEVLSVPFPEGVIDIDTPKDYEQLRTMTDSHSHL